MVMEIPEIGPRLDVYQREDGAWVCHIDTTDMAENNTGPLLTVYMNDCPEPLWANPEPVNAVPGKTDAHIEEQ